MVGMRTRAREPHLESFIPRAQSPPVSVRPFPNANTLAKVPITMNLGQPNHSSILAKGNKARFSPDTKATSLPPPPPPWKLQGGVSIKRVF